MPRLANSLGSTWMRTAYFAEPKTCTCATPSTMEMRCAIMVSAYSSRSLRRMVGEVRNRLRMGWSPGLTLRNEGGVGMPGGSRVMASAMGGAPATVAPGMLGLGAGRRGLAGRTQGHALGDGVFPADGGAINVAAAIDFQVDVDAATLDVETAIA